MKAMHMKFFTPFAIIALAMVTRSASAGSLTVGAHEHAANHGGIYIKKINGH